jgi:MFS transporter, ACS family, tartrate transporter
MDVSIDDLEKGVISKIAWRILPLILVAYCVAYIDRSNIAVAALTMNRDLGLSAFIYGLGAGIFFVGYFIFEIPSNLILDRVGARRWIARILFTSGIFSAATAFVAGPVSFVVVRFLLGIAEAGFFPGIILYLTYWFPDRYRGRVISAFFLALPIANAISNVVSGLLLGMDDFLGIRSWQWLFLIQATPAIVLSFVVLRTMTDRPALAKWLQPHERQWLEAELETDRAGPRGSEKLTLAAALTDSRVIILSMIYFLSITAGYGMTFFMPQIVKGLGFSNLMSGVASAIPYLVGMIGLLLWGWSSDRSRERRWHLISALIAGCVGLAAAGAFVGSLWALAAMCFAQAGIYGSRPSFWPLPSMFLSGSAAAGGIALINSIGNVGGYVGPFVVGWIKDSTNSFEMGLYFLAACLLASSAIAFYANRAGVARPLVIAQPLPPDE